MKAIKNEHDISNSDSDAESGTKDKKPVINGSKKTPVKKEPESEIEQLKVPIKKAKSLQAKYGGPVKVGDISPRKTRSFTQK